MTTTSMALAITTIAQEPAMNIHQLADALAELERRGWITSLRAGNTGIGYTLESLLNVPRTI